MGRDNRIILAVGAHPDDIELGSAGTLKEHINHGDKVYGIVVTDGSNGSHCKRNSECRASFEYLGMEDLIELGFPDGYLRHDGKSVEAVEKVIRLLKPNRIYAHSESDRHQDHQTTARIVQSAGRKVHEVYLFETPSTTPQFTPTAFNEVSQTLPDKLKALEHYQSQIDKGIVDLDRVEGQARYWGKINGLKLAEAYETYRHIMMIKR
jgi:LmbE family N-acetylglucosaminyl deacetylase